MFTIDDNSDIYGPITDPPGNARSPSVPGRIAHDQIGKPTWLVIVRENRGAFEVPFVILRRDPAGFMTGHMDAAPENRWNCQNVLQKTFSSIVDSGTSRSTYL